MFLLVTSQAMAAPLGSPAPQPPALEQSAHAQQVAQYGQQRTISTPARSVLPRIGSSPALRVYGYLAYWDADLPSVQWDEITDLALFNANATSTGGLTSTENWDDAASAVALADPYGVRVHLVVTNFDSDSLETLLGSAAYRDDLIAELSSWVTATGAHGVNVDFESLPAGRRTQMVTLVQDLAAEVGEVVLAIPAVDWGGSWDVATLSQSADLFIMGYDYHWSGSSYAGPSDPLHAGTGTVWSGINSYSLSRTVDDYLAQGADPTRTMLGLPLYGRRWPVSANAVPAGTLATGSTVLFRDAAGEESTHGRYFEPDSASPYTFDGADQIWYGDLDSVQERIAYVRDDTALSGIGFWALHYTDDPAFWQMVHDETRQPVANEPGTDPGTEPGTDAGTDAGTDPGTDAAPSADGPFTADAGAPFLAYVGDTVILSAEGSIGPSDVELQYRWTQREGPPVILADDRSATPSFQIRSIGNLVFEVEVGDGSDWSEPARSYVVVIDPGIARRHSGACGVPGTAAPFGGLSLLILLGLRRRTA